MELKVSLGNSKMGNIPSVSLPAGKTCRKDCECYKICYARKIERLRKTVRDAYENNLKLLNEHPDIYWREVEATIMMSRFFRFHVSGDIPDIVYLCHMNEIAIKNSHCEILCFTKRYDIINEYLDTYGEFPENLHIILSAWDGLNMYNPHLLPEAHVRYKDGHTTAKGKFAECSGNCAECAITTGGCWSLKRGERVIFNQH